MGIEIIFKIAAIGIVTSIVNAILKQTGKDELTTFTSLSAVVVVLFMVIKIVTELFDTVKNLFSF